MLTLRPYQAELTEKTHLSMRTGHRRPLVVCPTGGGKTAIFADMASKTQKNKKIVWFLVHRRELLDQTIETFRKFDIPTRSIFVGMVGQVANNADKFPDPDLIIFDEGHHASAATWRKITDRFPDAWLIGLTATPCRLDGKPLGQIYDDIVIGPTTAELIEQGYLSDYKYFAVDVADLSALRQRGKEFDLADASDQLMQRAVYGDVVETYLSKADGLQAICFCTTVQHSAATAEAFNHHGIEAVHFDGNTPAKLRKDIIARFRSGLIRVLCNVELVGEGFDMPACDCVIQLRPTQSLALYLQQVGRALRPRDGKTAIILDHVGNHTRHGLPDDARDWSLETEVKAKQTAQDGSFLIRQCAQCYAVYPAAAPICPVCGRAYEKTRAEIRSIEAVRLREIERQKTERKKKRIESLFTESDCRSYSDLYQLAKKAGVKNPRGWAISKAGQRGWWHPRW